jgi:hypothetical protein
MAEAAPVAAPASQPQPQPQPQFAAAPAEPEYYAEARTVRTPQPVEVAPVEVAPVEQTLVEKIAEKATAPAMVALAAVAAAEAPTAVAALAPKLAPKLFKRAAAPRPVRASAPKPVKAAVARRGNSSAVVQLGAYGSTERVLAAWNNAARKYPAVRAYAPMSARFSSPRGVVYRLAVKGFASNSEATALCASVRRSGGSCFVRNFAGDTPVQYASR